MTVAAAVCNALFALSLSGTIFAVELLAFVSFGIDVLVIASLTFFVIVYVRKLGLDPSAWSSALCWRFLTMGVTASAVALPVSLITLVWIAIRLEDLRSRVLHRSSEAIFIGWFCAWGLSAILQFTFYGFVGWWTKKAMRSETEDQLSLDFGIGSPEMTEARPGTRDTTRSFQSQEGTLASPPRTPTTPRRPISSSLSSSATRVGPGSSRTKLIQNSAKSSFDLPAGETASVDSAFDRWDTSSVHREVRMALQSSSPPVTRSGLPTIPGSRPDSPATALDGPFLPDSPHATSSDTATAVDWIPSSRKASFSSPPSSPPNFSRPTSRQHNQSALSAPQEEFVHPLFRPTSPNPAPIAAPGTIITASPMAGKTITPRTLSRIRSGSLKQPLHQQPPVEQAANQRPPNEQPHIQQLIYEPLPNAVPVPQFDAQSSNGSSPGTPGAGSPGPSIVEEAELPPIIPGFVLSAGQRSSLVGYGKRKSVKDRPKSTHSQRSRRSSLRMD